MKVWIVTEVNILDERDMNIVSVCVDNKVANKRLKELNKNPTIGYEYRAEEWDVDVDKNLTCMVCGKNYSKKGYLMMHYREKAKYYNHDNEDRKAHREYYKEMVND